jgi:hypothetical protein
MFSSKNQFLTGAGGYKIQRSVRTRLSASGYFNRTAITPTNNKIFTWSAWIKRGLLGSANYRLFSSAINTDEAFRFIADTFQVFFNGATSGNIQTTQLFRDPSAWYHIVVAIDTSQATAANRVKIYVNGSQVTAFSTASYPAQNYTTSLNAAGAVYMARADTAIEYFDGYLTEINFVDGQQLTPSSFGQIDPVTGVWQPIKYAGTYGTNGFYLNFSDNSAATAAAIGKDYSGNGNNWTPNNISVTAGTTYDSMLDSPTPYADGGNGRGNYPVWNSLKKVANNYTITDANLTASDASASNTIVWATMYLPTSGKFYWEITNVTGSGLTNVVGAAPASYADSTGTAATGFYRSNGQIQNAAGTNVTSGNTYTNGDVIGVAVDIGAGTVQFYKNGVAQGATPSFTFTAGDVLVPFCAGDNTAGTKTYAANFGQRPFAYTPPTGFVALNTQNLPAPSISNGANYMAATLYTGNGTGLTVNNAVNNISFKPDLIWIKTRSTTGNHGLVDSVRGNYQVLFPNLTNAESAGTAGTGVTAFGSNGFTIGTDTTTVANMNINGTTYIAWQWNTNGGSSSSNTNGSITSTVSVNATAGFSVVTYTGNGTAGATVGHGLGVAPKMFIVKTRPSANGWSIYHASANASPATGRILFDTAAWAADSLSWNNTLPTSSVFSLGTSGATNGNGTTYVAYCFAEVAGYSKIGSWQNNNSTDGTFVYCGFRPRFLLLKSYDSTENWYIEDSSRQTYNYAPGNTNFLLPNATNAEQGGVTAATAGIDFLANGFKIRSTNTASGEIGFGTRNYIFLAIAENPFKNSLAR